MGQTHKIDSIKTQIRSARNASGKLNSLLDLCDEAESLPTDTLWYYALQAKSLSFKVKNSRAESLAVLAQAKAYLKWDNPDSAKSLVVGQLIKYNVIDPATRDLYFKLEQCKIDCNGDNFDYKQAIAQVYGLMGQAEKYKDTVVIAECMNTLGAWNSDMYLLPASDNWLYKALALTSDQKRFYSVRAALYLNLVENYNWIQRSDSALYFTNKAIQLSRKMEDVFDLSVALQKRAIIYADKKQFAEAEKSIAESIVISKKINGNVPQQDKLIVLATLYEKSGRPENAVKVLNDGLTADSLYRNHSPHNKRKVNAGDLQRIIYYQELAQCYKLMGNLGGYSQFVEKVINGKDAFYKTNVSQTIADLETKYEMQKQKAMIAQQRLHILQDRYFFYGLAMLALSGGVIVWLLFRSYNQKQVIKMQGIKDDEKLLSLLAVAEAEELERRRIAADLHDNLGAQLSYIKRNVSFVMNRPENFSVEDERKYLSLVNDTAQNAMIDLRETIWVLNADEVLVQDFADKLKGYVRQQLLNKGDIKWDFKEAILINLKLTSGEVMHIFRILQEVIANILNHSGATMINMQFSTDAQGNYELEVSDNGKGFKTNSKSEGHYGLENMRQRSKEISASLTIESCSLSGTKINLKKLVK